MIELTPAMILEGKAESFATLAHGKQKYGDKPYSYHLQQVVNNVKFRNYGDQKLDVLVAVAWLHDTLEDTDTTFEELEKQFGLPVAFAVRCLTKSKGESYERYILSCIDNPLAREVKICDTMANLTESFKSGNAKGLAKYPKQLHMLIEGCVD